MTSRVVYGTADDSFIDWVLADLLNHLDDSRYEVLFICSPEVGSAHDYHIVCENLQGLDKDRDYLGLCIIKATDNAYTNGTEHPGPQPFTVTRHPKQS